VGAVISPEGHERYSGRLLLATLSALTAIFWPGISRNTRQLGLVLLSSSFLWTFAGAEIRYGLYLEILGGIVLVCLIAEWSARELASPFYRNLRRLCAAVLSVQTLAAYYIAIRSVEPSPYMNGRPQPTVFQDPANAFPQARYILSDYSAWPFLGERERALLKDVDVWIAADNALSGVEYTYRPDVPIVSVHSFVEMADYYKSPLTRAELDALVAGFKGKRMYALAWENRLERVKTNLAAAGFRCETETPMLLPFYSHQPRLPLILVRVSKEQQAVTLLH
jgi:hypothetical protein